MKKVSRQPEGVTRHRFATLVEISGAAAIYAISGARRVRVWKLLPRGREVQVALTTLVDDSGTYCLEGDGDIAAAARPLLHHTLLARVADRCGQIIERDAAGGFFRHAFPVISRGDLSAFVEVEGVDPALVGLYSSYRRREAWRLDMARLLGQPVRAAS